MTAVPTAVLACLAFERAATHPSRSPGRRAATAACEALKCSTTTDRARRRLEGIHDPAVRDAALAVLDELEQVVDAPEETRAGGTS